jgi:phosphatidylinositol glycan class B
MYYGIWTIPPIQFLYFNLAQSIAVFYGVNDWHYYISQGLPLLLTTFLPLALLELYKALNNDGKCRSTSIRFQLACTTGVVITILSLVSHKEVRFIYPLLPILHVLSSGSLSKPWWTKRSTVTRELFIIPLVLHILLIFYVTRIHQSGVIGAMDYLRTEYESKYMGSRNMTVGFLMPCHSTPWQSHLIYPEIKAWALTCEPPLNMEPSQKSAYLDEADRFYHNPDTFIEFEKGLTSGNAPEYLVFFEQLTPTIKKLNSALVMKKSQPYAWSRSIFNSHFHDDSRRTGNVVIYSKEPGPNGQRIDTI